MSDWVAVVVVVVVVVISNQLLLLNLGAVSVRVWEGEGVGALWRGMAGVRVAAGQRLLMRLMRI